MVWADCGAKPHWTMGLLRGIIAKDYNLLSLGAPFTMIRYPRRLYDLIRFARLLFTLLCDAGRFLLLGLRPSPALAAENLVLRKQLALYQERHVKPRRATNAMRIALVWLWHWFDWRSALRIVQPGPACACTKRPAGGLEEGISVALSTSPYEW